MFAWNCIGISSECLGLIYHRINQISHYYFNVMQRHTHQRVRACSSSPMTETMVSIKYLKITFIFIHRLNWINFHWLWFCPFHCRRVHHSPEKFNKLWKTDSQTVHQFASEFNFPILSRCSSNSIYEWILDTDTMHRDCWIPKYFRKLFYRYWWHFIPWSVVRAEKIEYDSIRYATHIFISMR